MYAFFLLNILGGLLKFLYAYFNDDVETLDAIALAYAVILFIAMLSWWLVFKTDPLEGL